MIKGLLIALDYAVGMLFFWKSQAPMTVSSHAGMALRRGEKHTPLALLGRFLNLIDHGHTEASISNDINRAEKSLNYLK
jgi:hypothetical protein